MANDPRDPNCRAYTTNPAGLVTGVELVVQEHPAAAYALVHATLIDEVTQGVGGPTVIGYSVLDASGAPVEVPAWVCYPWWNFQTYMPPGNPNHQFVVPNKYWPPALGPLAFYLGNADHSLTLSDAVAGFGLPQGHHVSFALTFRQRPAQGDPPPVEQPPAPPANSEWQAAVKAAQGQITASLGQAVAGLLAFTPQNIVVVPPPPPPVPPPVPTVDLSRVIAPRLHWPVPGAVVTQRFGEHPAAYARFGLIGHNGLDLAAPLGTPITALHGGEAWVYDDPGGYGLTVEVWYPSIQAGLFKTICGHMAKQDVVQGAMVTAGQPIGLLGSTGNSTGPHTHLGLKFLHGQNPGYNGWVDPTAFLDLP